MAEDTRRPLKAGGVWALVLARVGLGVSFLTSDHGVGKPGELAGFIRYSATGHGYAWYAAFLRAVVLPRIDLFGTLVLIAELYVGAALVLGLTTRLAAGLAIFLCLNYLAAKGAPPWGPGIDQSDVLLAIIVIATSAGRIWAVDGVLHRRFPKAVIW